MYVIHWQGETLVKCEPYSGTEPVLRPGRTAEYVEDDDPRIQEWRDRVQAERAAKVARDTQEKARKAEIEDALDLLEANPSEPRNVARVLLLQHGRNPK